MFEAINMATENQNHHIDITKQMPSSVFRVLSERSN